MKKLPIQCAVFAMIFLSACSYSPPSQDTSPSKRSESAKELVKWGVIAAAFSVLGIVMNLVNGAEFSILNVLTGVAIPVLYIYGAVLNSKADDTQPTA